MQLSDVKWGPSDGQVWQDCQRFSQCGRPTQAGPRRSDARQDYLRRTQAVFHPGYHDAGIADIVAHASVTRGSLYYHFTEKRDLFEAVFRQIIEEKFEKIVDAVEPLSDDRWGHFLEALKEDLRDVASDLAFQRIVLIDGPAVLGWPTWHEIRTSRSGEVIAAELERLMVEGIVRRLNASLTAHLVMATLSEAALAVASNQKSLSDAIDALEAMVTGLRITGGEAA